MNITGYFDEVKDFRVVGRCSHLLSDILGLVLIGSLADCNDYSEIADYGNDNEEELKAKLGFIFPEGIPSEDTLDRVIRHLNSASLEVSFKSCLEDLSLIGRHICIDGKALRGTIPKGKQKALVQMVNVWVDELGLSFGQAQIEKKSNEIVAIPQLLDQIDCEGSVITIDAIACQKEIVKKIIGKKADYIIALKANQKNLYEAVVNFMESRLDSCDQHKSVDIGHGRGEERRVYSTNKIDLIDQLDEWKRVQSIVMIERTRYLADGKKEYKRQYFISSLSDASAEQFGEYLRGHWAIENRLHWQLDFTFREDASRVRKDKGPANLHFIRKWVLFLLKKNPEKISIKRKRKKAGRSIDYIIDLFHNA